MFELPPGLEKFLQSLGINTGRLKWKLYYFSQYFEKMKAKRESKKERKKYKYCRCGAVNLADDKTCGTCGKKLLSYSLYTVNRCLAIGKFGSGYITLIFLFVIAALFALQGLVWGPKIFIAPNAAKLYPFGVLTGNAFWSGEYLRILTMALVHFGIMHILFNAIAISQVLPYFEEEIGDWATIILITVTQLAAAAAHLVHYNPYTPTGGASGVAFGLIGFGIAFFHRRRQYAQRKFFIQWFIYGVIFGIMMRANNAAHIGGFIAGLPLGYIFAVKRDGRLVNPVWKIIGIICAAAWIVSIAWIGWMIIHKDNKIQAEDMTEYSEALDLDPSARHYILICNLVGNDPDPSALNHPENFRRLGTPEELKEKLNKHFKNMLWDKNTFGKYKEKDFEIDFFLTVTAQIQIISVFLTDNPEAVKQVEEFAKVYNWDTFNMKELEKTYGKKSEKPDDSSPSNTDENNSE